MTVGFVYFKTEYYGIADISLFYLLTKNCT